MENSLNTAFLLIDMEKAFVSPESTLCVKGAANTVPNCQKALAILRSKNIPIFFIKRLYRQNGSDVESTRYQSWLAGGRPMTPDSPGAEWVKGLEPEPNDYIIIKPRWSAFFQTELDLILRRLGIRTVILAGTTTPNCIRTTCYDANSLDYNVIVLADCTSSQTQAIQHSNLDDMERMGAIIMNSEELKDYRHYSVPDLAANIRSDIKQQK